MNKTLHLTLFLGVVCAIAGAGLSFVNSFTAPKIAENEMAGVKATLEMVYPGGEFTAVDFVDDTGLVAEVYQEASNGYIFKMNGMGYNTNGFTYMVAINNDGAVDAFVELEQNETSGFGARCFTDEYTSQLIGQSDNFPTLSGASLTSGSIVKGLDAAKAVFESLK